MPALFLNSGVLFNVAKGAAKNAASGNSVHDNALIATVFSVVGTEAFINEAIELASNLVVFANESDPTKVKAFAEIERQIEESHGPLELKYQIAKWVFSGEAFDRGANPYQDFALLLATRNALVHYKVLDKMDVTLEGDIVKAETPAILERLRGRKILSDIPSDIHASWLGRIATPAMAAFSCKAASAIVKAVAALPPQGVFKVQMELLAKSFEVEDSL